jgi:hypothetical protein
MLYVLEIGLRVLHPDLGIGKVKEISADKILASFRGREVQFNKDEPTLSLVTKGKTSYSSSLFHRGSKSESVLSVMRDGLFRSLQEISELSDYESLTGLSACIRAFRKEGCAVDKRKRQDSNEYEYRVAV